MKITEYSEKVRELQKMHPDLPRASESGVVIYQFEFIDGSVKLAIDVSDFSTHQDIRDAIPLAMEWRDRLIEFQGVTGLFTKYEFLKLLYTFSKTSNKQLDPGNPFLKQWEDRIGEKEISNRLSNRKRITDRNIVDAINYRIHKYWLEVVNKSDIRVGESPFSTVLEFMVNAVENKRVGPLPKVKSMLAMFRLDNEEIDLACDEGIKIAESSNPVYPLEFPLTYSKYKFTKRWFKTQQI